MHAGRSGFESHQSCGLFERKSLLVVIPSTPMSTSGQSNSTISKCTFQDSSHLYLYKPSQIQFRHKHDTNHSDTNMTQTIPTQTFLHKHDTKHSYTNMTQTIPTQTWHKPFIHKPFLHKHDTNHSYTNMTQTIPTQTSNTHFPKVSPLNIITLIEKMKKSNNKKAYRARICWYHWPF